MSVVRAAGIQNVLINAGTRLEVVDNLKATLVTSGWTVASGASGDWILECLAGNVSQKMRVRLYDPGSGNCTQVIPRNVSENKIGAAMFLLPATSQQFRVNCDQHQCLVSLDGSATPRTFLWFGILWVPAHLEALTTNGIWAAHSNASSDTDTTVGRYCFRTCLHWQNNYVAQTAFLNENIWTGRTDNDGGPELVVPVGAAMRAYTAGKNRALWYDGSSKIVDAELRWGLTAYTDTPFLFGLMYNCFVLTKEETSGVVKPYDEGGGTHNYRAITENNVGGPGPSSAGTLFMAAD